VNRDYQELRSAVLQYLQVPTSDEAMFTRNSTDLILVATNNALRTAQKRHDFNYLLHTAQVTVDPSLGVDWTSITNPEGTGTTLRRLECVFLVQATGVLPIRWMTRAHLANEVLRSNDRSVAREWYPTDAVEYVTDQYALVEGNKIYIHPKPDTATTVELTGYKWLADMASASDTNFIIEFGFDWLMWQTLVELNYFTKQFVARQEGNLPPPTQMAERAWLDLVDWDNALFEKQVHFLD
jgi:hypothetical protein